MGKCNSFEYRFTVLLFNSDERVVSGLVSLHDLKATTRLALGSLRLDSRISLAEIHKYVDHAEELVGKEPVARVTLDDEDEGAAE